MTILDHMDFPQVCPGDPFDRGLEAEAIVESAHVDSRHLYRVKWYGTSETSWIPAHMCHYKIPDLVIDFLVQHLKNVPIFTRKQIYKDCV